MAGIHLSRRIGLVAFLLLQAVSVQACGPTNQVPLAQTAPAPSITPGGGATTTSSADASATPSMLDLIEPYTIAGLRQKDFGSTRIEVGAMSLQTDIFKRFPISYRSDGLLITGVMQVPTQGRVPFPVIVMNHGFFNREEYHSGDGTDRAAEYLNKHGYLTLSSDYRSWGGSDVGPSLYYSGLAIDVVNLINGVKSIPQADAARIGIWGHSMGGGVTMKVLMLNTPIKAAVLYSPVSADDADILGRWGLGCIGDIRAGEHQLGCNSSDVVPLDLPPELIKAYYESSMDPEALRQTSPIDHLDLVSVPVQIHFGTADGKTLAGTPPDWSRKLYEALKQAGKTAELFGYDGALHSFNGDDWIAFMERSAHFFDEYVKDAKP